MECVGLARTEPHRRQSSFVAVAVAVLVAGTVVVLALCWLAFERRGERLGLPIAGLVALVLLVVSVPMLHGLQGRSPEVVSIQLGVPVWRWSMVLVALAAVRSGA
jgi:hypothetical protein